ncbi:MAG: hypothetical protein J0L98_20580 [Zoogloea sp.]|nr:hypothetical protein [Zoogloea sp.]
MGAPKEEVQAHKYAKPLKRDLSRKDVEACLACDPGEFGDSPFEDEVQALMQVLKIKAE